MGFIRRHKKGQDYGPERQGKRVPGRMMDRHHAPSKPLWQPSAYPSTYDETDVAGVSYDTDPTNAYGILRTKREPNKLVDFSHGEKKKSPKKKHDSSTPYVKFTKKKGPEDTDPTPPHGIPRPDTSGY